MTRYLVEWEIEGKVDINMIRERLKATKENKTVKAWGLYSGTRKGFVIVEPSSEKEFQVDVRKWSSLGIKNLSATPFLNLEEFEQTLS